MSNGPAASIVREANNVIYFTREQLAAGLRFSVPSLVKQFLHFTRAPPVLVHPNVFHILMGYSVLNFLYQLDISLIEVCFIYTLKLGIGGRLSMSAYSPRLQFVTGLPNSPKIEAKGVVLVKGPWYETSCSTGLSFDLNRSLVFPALLEFCAPQGCPCFEIAYLFEFFIGKRRRGRLVS